MSRLAQPQYFFLHLRHALESHLYRKVSSRNHHSHRGKLKRAKKDTRQILEPCSRFYLQQNPRMLCMHFAKHATRSSTSSGP